MVMWAALSPLLFALTAAAGPGGLRVESDVECPSAAALVASLTPLFVPPGVSPPPSSLADSSATLPGKEKERVEGAYAGHRLSIAPGDRKNTVRLRLEEESGAVVGRRDWDAGPNCTALAGELAVVAATWLTALPPPAHEPLALPRPPPRAADSGPSPPPSPSPAAAGVQQSAGAPVSDRRFPFAFGLGAGFTSTGDAQLAAAFSLHGMWTSARFPHFSLSIGVATAGSWQRRLAEGGVVWRRWTGALDAGWQKTWRRLAFMAIGGVQGGALSVSGMSFAESGSAVEPEVALVAGGRLSLALGAGGHAAPRLWLAARAAWGLVHYSARVLGTTERRSISSLQIGPMLGIEFPLAL